MANRRLHALASALLLSTATGAGATSFVTPSGPTVPENLLRIELRLDTPLAHPLDMARVRLLDAAGTPIAGAFLDLPLPARDGRSVTLLLHPGRVKSGVGANLALGRALHEGEAVTLVVDDPQLRAPLRRRWRVTPARSEALSPQFWAVDAPKAGTRQPLRVTMGSALTASQAGLVAIRDAGGARVQGVASLADGETVWRFAPTRPWRRGAYAVVAHPRLEDVAGNRPCTPFEAVALSAAACRIEARPFEIGR